MLVAYYAILRFRETEGSYKGHAFRLEMADTTAKRRLGLSFRKGLDKDHGMLFAYPDFGLHIVWMMNMRFSIDILWLDEQKRIAYAVQNAPRSRSWSDFAIYNPRCKSRYVVELPEGAIKNHNIKIGTKIDFQMNENPN